MMDIQYGYLSPDDIDGNRAEMLSLMETVLADNITQDYPADLAEQYVGKMREYIIDGSAVIVGAKAGGTLVGFSWAYELAIFGERRLHITMIGVNSDYRRKGIAKALVNMQIEAAKKRDIGIIEAMTTTANENSYRWFHSMGFGDERVKLRLDLN